MKLKSTSIPLSILGEVGRLINLFVNPDLNCGLIAAALALVTELPRIDGADQGSRRGREGKHQTH